jgi:hypothetical protein
MAADSELIAMDRALRRVSAVIGHEGSVSEPLARVELAYLRDRIAATPAASLEGAAIKLRGLLVQRGPGGRLGAAELDSLWNVLAILETAGHAGRLSPGAYPPGGDRPTGPSDISDEAAIVELVAELGAVALRHRALLDRNLELRAELAASVGRAEALRTHLDTLESAVGGDLAARPAAEPKFLALFRYWDERRGGRTMPRRADIDPLDLTDLWPDLGLWRREPSADFRCTFCGTQIASLIAEDPTGKLLSEVRGSFWIQERPALENVARSGRPALSARLLGGNRTIYRQRSLTLPLSRDDRVVDALLTATVFRDSRGKAERAHFTHGREHADQ